MGSKGSQTTTQQSSTTAVPQAESAYSNLLNQAQATAATPYQAYTGQLVAPFNAEQNTGVAGINQYANAAQPSVNYALNQAASSSAPLTASGIQQYESPYTQQVVNSTQAQFNNQNAQQQQGIVGNAVAQGALGGNREAIAQAETANQENLAQAPVIAGLENTGYTNAVNTAEQQQALGLQGANSIGNLGVAGQTAGLTGAGTELGAGTQQQGTQQALDTALLQQYQQQQAYPFQTAQWLAGLDTGVGTAMGSNTSGETTAPAPNALGQILGGVTSGAGLLGATGAYGSAGWLAPLLASDRRVKENIDKIGKLNDGQIIYRFNYKGDKATHIGLMAQEVEKKHPDSVHQVNGLKMVDYKSATDDSIKRADGGQVKTPKTFRDHLMEWADEQGLPQALIEGIAPKRAYGGGVNGYAAGGASSPYTGGIQGSPMGVSGTPWAMAPSYVPTFSGAHGSPTKTSGPTPATIPQNPMTQQANSLGSLAKAIKDGVNGNNSVPGAQGPTSIGGAPLVNPNGSMTDAQQDYLQDLSEGGSRGGVMGYARGGIAGYADGGDPDAVDDPTADQGPFPLYGQRPSGDPTNMPPGMAAYTPDDGSTPAQGVLPTVITKGKSKPDNVDVSTDTTPLAFSDDNGIAPADVRAKNEPQGVAPSSGFDWGSSNKLWPALISAGFGAMSSRSPFLANVIGEGGQAGINSYNQQHKEEIEAQQHAEALAHQAKQETLEEQKVKQSAINQPVIFDSSGKAITNPNYSEAQEENKVPFGWQTDDKGVPHFIPGGPADPEYAKKLAEAKTKVPFGWMQDSQGNLVPIPGGPTDPSYIKEKSAASKGATLGDDTARSIARYTVATGDDSRLKSLGFNPANKALVQKYIDQEMTDNKVDDASMAKRKQDFAANQTRLNAGARTQATREENLNLVIKAADAAIPAALEESAKVKRYTGIVPFDRIIQNGQIVTNDPNLVSFGMANLQLAEHWARAMNPMGVMRESDRDLALHYLDTAFSQDTYEAAIRQLQKQITRERDSIAVGKTTIPTNGQAVPGVDESTHASPLPKTAQPISIPTGAVNQKQDTKGNWWYIDKDGNVLGQATH